MTHVKLRDLPYPLDSPKDGLDSTVTVLPVGDAASADNVEGTDYRQMVEKINEGIIVTQDNTIRYANPRAFGISGYSPGEISGRSLLDFVHPDDRDMVAAHHRNRTAGSEQPEVYLLRIINKMGQVRWIRNNGVLIEWHGRPATLNMLSDVTRQKEAEDALKANEQELQQYREQLETKVSNRTEQLKSLNRQLQTELKERRLTEEALRRSEERYRFLVENTTEGYYLADHDSGGFVYANHRVCRMLDCRPDELTTMTIWDILAAEDHAAFRSRMMSDAAPQNGCESTPVYTCIRRSGSTFRGEISISVDRFQGRRVIQGIMRDVTENERFLNRLQEIQKLETIATLAGGIAHDFNNILMAMQGNVSLLLVKLNQDHPLYGKVDNIQQQIRNGAHLIRQLLGFARGGKYEAKVIDMNRLIEETVQMINPAKRRIELQTRFQADIWMVRADRGQIEQALLNMMVNAWQAMPEGGRLTVVTRNRRLQDNEVGPHDLTPGKFVHVSIRDSGIGMNAEIMNRIFDPFFTTKDSSRGTGLGLSSAYGIIKNHGGFIEVESRVGEGTTFDIYLPAGDAALQKESSPADTAIMVGDETVLFVDDEEMILEAGAAMLSEFGYQVHPAADGAEALALLKRHSADIELVVLDWHMPGISGRDLFEQMRAVNPALPILVTSGRPKDDRFRRFMERNRTDFLAKPFTAVDLSQKIREMLDSTANRDA